MNLTDVGPSGLDLFIDNVDSDLTVGAISSRPFGPDEPGRYRSRFRDAIAHHLAEAIWQATSNALFFAERKHL